MLACSATIIISSILGTAIPTELKYLFRTKHFNTLTLQKYFKPTEFKLQQKLNVQRLRTTKRVHRVRFCRKCDNVQKTKPDLSRGNQSRTCTEPLAAPILSVL